MRWLLLFACLFVGKAATSGDLPNFNEVKIRGVIHSAVGVTRRGTPIDLFVSAEDTRYNHDKTRIVLVGGTDGERGTVDGAMEALRWFYTDEAADKYRKHLTLAAIPCGNPDGLLDSGPENRQGGGPLDAPRKEKRYLSETNVEAQYREAWFEQHGAVAMYFLQVDPGKAVPALQVRNVDGKGSIPLATALDRWIDPAAKETVLANKEQLQKRVRRDDREFVIRQLQNYSHLPTIKNYFDTLPLKANARLASLKVVLPGPPIHGDAELPKSGSELSGLLYLLEEPWRTESKSSAKLLTAAADIAFDKQGKPLPSPPLYSQMSDAVFMNGPILTGVGKFSGDAKYFSACAQHQAVIRKDCKREDNLYRHSPLCEAAWGRGNGFVAMGNALMLEDWPEDHPDRKQLLAEFQQHMAALALHQDYTGTWHQVIDHPESYREFTCTCMIGFAMARGVRGGWLDKEEFQPLVDRAWMAVKARTSDKGEFVDVCTGTGKQKSLRDYFDREATQGRDGRGASMLLMFASEILRD